MGIPFTGGMGFLLTATMGFLFTMPLGIQLTVSILALFRFLAESGALVFPCLARAVLVTCFPLLRLQEMQAA